MDKSKDLKITTSYILRVSFEQSRINYVSTKNLMSIFGEKEEI